MPCAMSADAVDADAYYYATYAGHDAAIILAISLRYAALFY